MPPRKKEIGAKDMVPDLKLARMHKGMTKMPRHGIGMPPPEKEGREQITSIYQVTPAPYPARLQPAPGHSLSLSEGTTPIEMLCELTPPATLHTP